MINAAQVITEAGPYFRDGGQGIKDVMTRIMRSSVTDKFFTDIQLGDDTLLMKATAQISDVLQAFQQAFTPKSTTTFELVKIPLFNFKIDLKETPDTLVKSWLGFLTSNNLNRKEWPFIRWWISALVMQKHEENYEMKEVFKGIYQAPVAGTASATGASMNGIRKVQDDHIASARLAPFDLGPVPTDAKLVVEYVQEFVNMIPKQYWPYLEPIKMSTDVGTLFVDGQDALYNINYNRINELFRVKNRPVTIASHEVKADDGTSMRIAGLPSHEGSSRIWTTIKGNSVLGIRGAENVGKFEFEQEDRSVKAWTDYWKGVGFWIPEYVFMADDVQ
ncbi:hypothetical protein [Siphonobacter sp. SORGH_AS_0500]|uniref:hypothetical protein n=1 Tax=Siphonobacter sp. SORGH_AS_0500 TaxID=1864824 RepID=UPI0028621350|nr:hypothetical protein [Siphonobacter sp. SORGH_AS_0500]MDR6196162.1 hypothetical protein [Siphonobacter sp. SORGH_AS_0500]